MAQFGVVVGPWTSKPCAFFSTHGGIYPPRDCPDPKPSPILYSNHGKAVNNYIMELRIKWPHICNAIFAPWHIHWFFDEHDFVMRGPQFLFDVLNKIVRENEEHVIVLSQGWSESQKLQFKEFAKIATGQIGVHQAFHQSDIEAHGLFFLEKVLQHVSNAYMKAYEVEHNKRPHQIQRYSAEDGSSVLAENISIPGVQGDPVVSADIVRPSPRVPYVPPHGGATKLILGPQAFRKRPSETPLTINAQIPAHFNTKIPRTALPPNDPHMGGIYIRHPGPQLLPDGSMVYIPPHSSLPYGLPPQTGPVQHGTIIYGLPMDPAHVARNVLMSPNERGQPAQYSAGQRDFTPFDQRPNGRVSSSELWQDPEVRHIYQNSNHNINNNNYNNRGNRGRRNSGGRGGRGAYGGHNNSFTRRSSLSQGESMERDRLNAERRRDSINDRDPQWKGENVHKANDGFPIPHLPPAIKEEPNVQIPAGMRTNSGPAPMLEPDLIRGSSRQQIIQRALHDPGLISAMPNVHRYPHEASCVEAKHTVVKKSKSNDMQEPNRLNGKSHEIRSGYIGEAVNDLVTLWVRIFRGATKSDIEAAFFSITQCNVVAISEPPKSFAFVTFPSPDVARKMVQTRFFKYKGQDLEVRVPSKRITHDDDGNPASSHGQFKYRMSHEHLRPEGPLSTQDRRAYHDAFEHPRCNADHKGRPRENMVPSAVSYSKQDARSFSASNAPAAASDEILAEPASVAVLSTSDVPVTKSVPAIISVSSNEPAPAPITWASIASKNLPIPTKQEFKSLQQVSPSSSTPSRPASTLHDKSMDGVPTIQKTPTKGSKRSPMAEKGTISGSVKKEKKSDGNSEASRAYSGSPSKTAKGSKTTERQNLPVIAKGDQIIKVGERKGQETIERLDHKPGSANVLALGQAEPILTKPVEEESTEKLRIATTFLQAISSSNVPMAETNQLDEIDTAVTSSAVTLELLDETDVERDGRELASASSELQTSPYVMLQEPVTCAVSELPSVVITTADDTASIDHKSTSITVMAQNAPQIVVGKKLAKVSGIRPQITTADSKSALAKLDLKDWEKEYYSVVDYISGIPDTEKEHWFRQTEIKRDALVELEDSIFKLSQRMGNGSKSIKKKSRTNYEKLVPKYKEALMDIYVLEGKMKGMKESNDEAKQNLSKHSVTTEAKSVDDAEVKRIAYPPLHQESARMRSGEFPRRDLMEQTSTTGSDEPRNSDDPDDAEWNDAEDNGSAMMPSIFEVIDEGTGRRVHLPPTVDDQGQIVNGRSIQVAPDGNFWFVDEGTLENKSLDDVIDERRGVLIGAYGSTPSSPRSSPINTPAGASRMRRPRSPTDSDRTISVAGARSDDSQESSVNAAGLGLTDISAMPTSPSTRSMSPVSRQASPPQSPRHLPPTSPLSPRPGSPFQSRPESPPGPNSPRRGRTVLPPPGPKSYASAVAASVEQTKSPNSNTLDPASEVARRASSAAKAVSPRPIVHLPTSAGSSRRNSSSVGVKGVEGKGRVRADDWEPGPEGVWGKDGFLRKGG